MPDLKSAAELRAASQASLVEFLRTDLAICSTLADVVTSELSFHVDGAKRALNKAERGYDTIEHFVTRVEDKAQRQEIEQSLTLLRSKLDALKANDGWFQKGPSV